MSDIYPSIDYEPVAPSRRGRAEAESASENPSRPDDGRVLRASSKKAAKGAERSASSGERRLRRGHALSYAGLFLFTAVLLFRPYELFDALSAFSTLAFWLALLTLLVFFPLQLSLEGRLSAPFREVSAVALFCFAALLSVAFANSPALAWETFTDTFIKAVLIFVVIVNVVRTERRLLWLIRLSLTVTLMLCLGAIGDYRTGNLPVEGYRIKGMIGGMFGNPNDLALHLVTMTPLAFALMLGTRNPLSKAAYGLLVILTIAANVVTFSRGGFLGLMGVAFVLIWKLGRRRRFMVATLGAVFLALFLALAPGGYGVRIMSIFIPGLDPVGSSSHRQGILKRSLVSSVANPVFGLGMGNFNAVSLGETVSHNAYTQVSAEMGLFALACYLIFIITPLKRLRRIENETFDERRRPRSYYLAVGLQASLVGYMISSFFASVAYQWYVYYLVGYAVCLHRLYEAERAAADAKGEGDDRDETASAGRSERERATTQHLAGRGWEA